MSIPQETIEQIRLRASLAEIVGERVSLKKSGRNLSGLCPFHAEKTPSFFVNEEEGFFHCFGCGKKGSVFDYVMETRGLSFPEAVRLLARRVGIEIEENEIDRERERERSGRKTLLRSLMLGAVSIYRNHLETGAQGRRAREYLSGRKLTSETRERYSLGFAPEQENIVESLSAWLKAHRPGLVEKEEDLRAAAAEVGLITVKDESRAYDTFRGRVIFPITRSDGSFIALGGRILEANPARPKYLNSCESMLYSKSRTLYGLSQAFDSMRSSREVFLVEGYMDVIAFSQLGITNVVASCGTSVTRDHVEVLKRCCDRVTVVFDGDAAGARAASAAFDIFLNSGIDMNAVRLSEGEDPGSLGEKLDTSSVIEILNARVPLIDIYLDNLFAKESPNTPVSAGKVASQAAKLLSGVINPVEKEFFTKAVSERLGVSVESMERLMAAGSRRFQQKNQSNQSATPQKKPVDVFRRASEKEGTLDAYWTQLLVSILCEPVLASTVSEFPSLMGGVDGEIPSNVHAFISEVAANPIPNIADIEDGKETVEMKDEPSHTLDSFDEGFGLAGSSWESGYNIHGYNLGKLRSLLDRFCLPHSLIDQAKKLSRVGGGSPAKVVEQFGAVVARGALAKQVEVLREREAAAGDEEARIRLLQEKLGKRRNMEKLRNVSKVGDV